MPAVNRRKSVRLTKPADFLSRLSILLREGYTFHEGLILILPYHAKEYEELLEQAEKQLKSGYGVSRVLKELGFHGGTMLPVTIAEVDGDLVRALGEVSARVERKEEKKRQIRKLLTYPAVLFVLLLLLLTAFRQFFLPNFEALAIMRTQGEKGAAGILPKIVAFIPDLLLFGTLTVVILLLIMTYFTRRMTPEQKLDYMLKIPVVGPFFETGKTRDFANELGSLLESGLSMQDALSVLAEQEEDPILSEITSVLSRHVIYGEPLHEAIRLTDGLSPRLADFAKHGADSGHLPKELLIYADHTSERMEEKVNSWMSVIQPALFGILAVCILLAYLAILLPVYRMVDTI